MSKRVLGKTRQIRSYLPLIVLAVMAVWLAWLLWRASRGKVWDPFVTGAATFVLVIVTIYYAWQSRRSAQNTEDTLVEVRKDRKRRGKILTIAFAIDPLLTDLREDKNRFEPSESGISSAPDCIPLRESSGWSKPDLAVKSDIEESTSFSNFSDTFDEYLSLVTGYEEKWSVVRDEIANILIDEFEQELSQTSEDTGHNPRYAAKQYAEYGMICQDPSWDPETLNQKLLGQVLELRDDIEFEGQIAELQSQIDKIRQQNEKIGKGLEKVRIEFKNDYDIAEHEIKEILESSNLSEGYTSHTPELTYIGQ